MPVQIPHDPGSTGYVPTHHKKEHNCSDFIGFHESAKLYVTFVIMYIKMH